MSRYKVLLIDDEALLGWKEVLEKVLFPSGIESCVTKEEAVKALSEEVYDLIFLDLRFGGKDHKEEDIRNFGGYDILNKHIRQNFSSLNFATPVIVFTASNKIWNIFEMFERGADSYYIKEHPDFASDIEFSRKNFIRLKHDIPELISMGTERQGILSAIKKILGSVSANVHNENIRQRIIEKLKIGYATLFHRHSAFEKENFVFSKELLAFIAFWSILEEVSKDSFRDNWLKIGDHDDVMKDGNWILRNGEYFIENLTFMESNNLTGYLRVNLKKVSGRYEKEQWDIPVGDADFSFYSGKVGLALQIYAVMIIGKKWTSHEANTGFRELNTFRNRIDFIHSSVSSIFNKNLTHDQDKGNALGYCIKMLDFLAKLIQ